MEVETPVLRVMPDDCSTPEPVLIERDPPSKTVPAPLAIVIPPPVVPSPDDKLVAPPVAKPPPAGAAPSPAAIVMAPVATSVAVPVVKDIDPLPPTEFPAVVSAPVLIVTLPLGPRTEVPDVKLILPLTPKFPEFGVAKVIPPLVLP